MLKYWKRFGHLKQTQFYKVLTSSLKHKENISSRILASGSWHWICPPRLSVGQHLDV